MRALRSFLLLFTSIAFLWSCSDDPASVTDPYRAVPSNASMIIELNNYSRAVAELGESEFSASIDSILPLQRLKQAVLRLQQQLQSEQLNRFLDERRFLLSVALSGADKFDLLLITPGDQEFEKFLGQRFSENFELNRRTYSGAEIYNFYQEEDDISYYLSSYQNLLLFSHSQTLVEEAIRQINAEFSLLDQPAFQKLQRTANRKDPANLYLNYTEAAPMFRRLLPRADLDFMPRFGQWLELDVQLFRREILMSGLSVLPEPGSSYLSVFSNCDAGQSSAASIVPNGSGAWISLNFENAEQYYRSYEEYLEKNGRLRKHNQLLQKLALNGKEYLLQWVDNEIGLIVLPGKGGEQTQVAYLNARDEEEASTRLDSMADASFIEGYRGVIIRKMKLENALPRVYGRLFLSFHHPYFFSFQDYVIFSESLPGLKGMINDILDEKTLAKDPAFLSFNNRLPDRSNLKTVINNPAALSLLQGFIDEEAIAEFTTYQKQLEEFRFAALQFNVDDQVAYANLYLSSSEKKEDKVSRVWSTSLKARVQGEPKLLLNHNSRKYDIAVQDEDNHLYLIDRKGEILWSRELDGPIMGEIEQVDAFRNKKLQMVFNTENRVYLVDRLGRDVENFPIELSVKATAPMAVMDYDNNRRYRLLIPQGEILSNLNLQGELVKGWDFAPAPAKIISKPQHFAVAGRDVIVAQLEEGSLLQLNRRGQQRFERITGLPVFADDFYIVSAASLSESELIAVADDGMLYSVKPGGSTDQVYLDQDYPADDLLYFEGRYIFSSQKSLVVKDDDYPWKAEFEGDISQAPKAMVLRGKFYVAAYSSRAEEIRLYDEKGELVSGFPVFAQGAYDMGSLNLDGSINIVTSSNDGTLICYRVN